MSTKAISYPLTFCTSVRPEELIMLVIIRKTSTSTAHNANAPKSTIRGGIIEREAFLLVPQNTRWSYDYNAGSELCSHWPAVTPSRLPLFWSPQRIERQSPEGWQCYKSFMMPGEIPGLFSPLFKMVHQEQTGAEKSIYIKAAVCPLASRAQRAAWEGKCLPPPARSRVASVCNQPIQQMWYYCIFLEFMFRTMHFSLEERCGSMLGSILIP